MTAQVPRNFCTLAQTLLLLHANAWAVLFYLPKVSALFPRGAFAMAFHAAYNNSLSLGDTWALTVTVTKIPACRLTSLPGPRLLPNATTAQRRGAVSGTLTPTNCCVDLRTTLPDSSCFVGSTSQIFFCCFLCLPNTWWRMSECQQMQLKMDCLTLTVSILTLVNLSA